MGLLIWILSVVFCVIVAKEKKYSVFGFALLALFLGPIMLVISLLLPANKSSAARISLEINSLQDARHELNNLKNNFLILQGRIHRLEEKLGLIEKQEAQPAAAAAQSHIQLPSEEEAERFEFKFGKYWLNRLGAIIFVLGVAFFISYTFKYLNAYAKLALGYMLGFGFLIAGSYLERKETYRKIAWGILGAGWGLLYLSTYAMHFIDATRIVSHPAIAIWLLGLVSFAAIIYNLKYNSWIVSFLTYFLAFITVGLGGIEYSTIIYCAFLVASIVFLSHKLDWYKFLLAGIGGTYLTFVLWINPQIYSSFLVARHAGLSMYQFQLSFGIIFLSWALFSGGLLLTKIEGPERLRYVLGGVLLNAAFFVSLGLHELYKINKQLTLSWDVRFWFLIAAAAVYFLLAYISKVQKKPQLIVAFVSIAFNALAIAVLIKAPRLNAGFFWILEMMVIFVLGIYYKELVYRMLAFVLGILFSARLLAVDYSSGQFYSILGWDIKHNIAIFSFAILCFYSAGALISWNRIQKNLKDDEKKLFAYFFPIFATPLLPFLLGEEVREKWLSLSWALEGLGILGLGFVLGNRIYRLSALAVLSLSCVRLIFIDMAKVETIYKIITFILLGAILLGVSLFYSKFIIKQKEAGDAGGH